LPLRSEVRVTSKRLDWTITSLRSAPILTILSPPKVAIDGNRRWLNKTELDRFDQESPLLTRVLNGANKPVIHNTYKLQKDDADTCGRWVCARIMNMEMPLHKFVDMMVEAPGTPDQAVTRYIYPFLGK